MCVSSRLVFSLIFCFLLASNAALAQKYKAQVVGITDGDTLKVLHDGRSETLRLAQIDCPETGQDYGSAAKLASSKLAFGKVVVVEKVGRDRFGRTIAELELEDGRSLNSELVKEGYAWQFTKYSNDTALHALEEDAKANRRGLWQAPNPVPPWEFRKQPKKERIKLSDPGASK